MKMVTLTGYPKDGSSHRPGELPLGFTRAPQPIASRSRRGSRELISGGLSGRRQVEHG
jgi:hypothetical protein